MQFAAQFDLFDYLRMRQGLVNRELERAVASAYPERLYDAMRYSLMSGGKRLRPVLCIAACEATGGSAATALPTACALEMLHTATLIHDDLPAMDDDDYRRGRLSNHKVFGEGMALLAGDALLAYSLEFIIDNTRDVPSDRLLRVMRTLIHMVGVHGAVGGQAVDMESEGRDDVDLATLEFIHTHKTGALLEAAVVTGAVLSGADEDLIARMSRFAQDLGLAFQIVDDVLDVTASREQLGKTPNKDQAARKATFPRLLGVEESVRRARDLVERAKTELLPLAGGAAALLSMADYVCARSS
ncbi:polyprenyl synthetase family protein [Dactylosporangium sp. NPDC050688]|uniref:polyprenyl synthetase family protein n=1 Tax=Dactylosporangium sp. NPDC050688 TaxID=3157217 RepID=UPI0033D21603